MERGQFDQPRPLEHEDKGRMARIMRIAPYLIFEHLMQDVDDGHMTRDEALARARALRPLVIDGEVE